MHSVREKTVTINSTTTDLRTHGTRLLTLPSSSASCNGQEKAWLIAEEEILHSTWHFTNLGRQNTGLVNSAKVSPNEICIRYTHTEATYPIRQVIF